MPVYRRVLLKEISDYQHVALMLSEHHASVEKFFDHKGEEKQDRTINNFRNNRYPY